MAHYFFDTSALVKHYHAEAGTAAVDRIIGTPAAELFIARVTLVETISVFAIKVRTGAFEPREFGRLRGLFATHNESVPPPARQEQTRRHKACCYQSTPPAWGEENALQLLFNNSCHGSKEHLEINRLGKVL